jgi:hypothetical protein
VKSAEYVDNLEDRLLRNADESRFRSIRAATRSGQRRGSARLAQSHEGGALST